MESKLNKMVDTFREMEKQGDSNYPSALSLCPIVLDHNIEVCIHALYSYFKRSQLTGVCELWSEIHYEIVGFKNDLDMSEVTTLSPPSPKSIINGASINDDGVFGAIRMILIEKRINGVISLLGVDEARIYEEAPWTAQEGETIEIRRQARKAFQEQALKDFDAYNENRGG